MKYFLWNLTSIMKEVKIKSELLVLGKIGDGIVDYGNNKVQCFF